MATHNQSARLIAVVDDNDEYLTVMEKALAEQSLKVLPFTSGAALLEHLQKCDEGSIECEKIPSAVILDLSLPGLSGHDTLQRIRSGSGQTARIPVVIFTQAQSFLAAQVAYTLGANAFVQKPADASGVAAAARQIGQIYGRLNRVPYEF